MEQDLAITRENAEERLAALWKTFESRTGLYLTLHDHSHCFIMPDGRKILPNVNIHSSPCCSYPQKDRKKCQEHCRTKAMELASMTRSPFVMTCWRGVAEVVLSLWQGNIHAFTVFAGVFRTGEFRKEYGNRDYRKFYEAMPILTDELFAETALLLTGIGNSVMRIGEQIRKEYPLPSGRVGTVRKFLMQHYMENAGAEDLALELGLSLSRTLHILKTEFGKGFADLLTEERLHHSEILLADTPLPLREIAVRCGFRNEYYFSSVFRKKRGITPGKFRKSSAEMPLKSP